MTRKTDATGSNPCNIAATAHHKYNVHEKSVPGRYKPSSVLLSYQQEENSVAAAVVVVVVLVAVDRCGRLVTDDSERDWRTRTFRPCK